MTDKQLLKKILILFLTTRIILTSVGVLSRHFFEESWGVQYVFKDHRILALDIWASYDSEWYLDIAKNGYSKYRYLDPMGSYQRNYAFFPLYPLLIRIFSLFTFNDYLVAGILISNISFLLSAFFLYKLTLHLSDKKIAERALYLLFLSPFNFLFSGVFTESLFLLFSVLTFYGIEKNKNLLTISSGFFMSLTRLTGAIAVPAMLILMEKKYSNKLKPYLMVIPVALGTAMFSIYNFWLTGNPLAFILIQAAWSRHLNNPFYYIFTTLLVNNLAQNFFIAVFSLLVIFFIFINLSTLPFAYWVLSVFMFLTPLSTHILGMSRYVTVIFPLYIYAAKAIKSDKSFKFCCILLFVFQMILMGTWALGMGFVI